MGEPKMEFDSAAFWDQIDNDLGTFDSYLKDTDWLNDPTKDGTNQAENESNEPTSYEDSVVKEKFDVTENELKKISDPKEKIDKVKQHYNENPISFNLANSINKLKKIAQSRREVDLLIEQLEEEIPHYEESLKKATEKGNTIDDIQNYYNMVGSIVSSARALIRAYREREEYGKKFNREIEYAPKENKVSSIVNKLYKKGYVKEGNILKQAEDYYKKIEISENSTDEEKTKSIIDEEEVKRFDNIDDAIEYFKEELPRVKKELNEIKKLYPDDSSMYFSDGNKDLQPYDNSEH